MGARFLETDTFTNKDISTAVVVGAYTATAVRFVMARLLVDQVQGNGDYVAYIKIQRNGAGSDYRIIPLTTANAASGVTAIGFMSGFNLLLSGDILSVYIDGLADTTTPDTICDFAELAALEPATADRTLKVDGDGLADANMVKAGPTGSGAAITAGSIPAAVAGASGGLAIVGSNVGTASSVIGTVGGIAGTTQTLDALQTAQNSAHGSGSWATATGFATSAALTTLTNIFTGITSLAQWLGLLGGKQVGNSTARTEMRATGAGSGTFDETQDSQEALRDSALSSSTIASQVRTELATELARIDTTVSSRSTLTLAQVTALRLANLIGGGTNAGSARWAVGDRVKIELRDVGDLNVYDNIIFAMKDKLTDADADAIILMTHYDGLTVILGATAADSTDGTMIVTDWDAGDVDIYLHSSVSMQLTDYAGKSVPFSLKGVTREATLLDDPDTTLAEGKVIIRLVAARARS